MAPPNPLQPIADNVSRLSDVVNMLLRDVLDKMDATLKPLIDFIKQVVKEIGNLEKQLASVPIKIGKATFDALLDGVETLRGYLPDITKEAKAALKFASTILATIKKAADPSKVFGAIKKLVSRLAASFRKLASMVAQVMKYLDPISAVLSLINGVKSILRMIASWIAQVSGALTAVKKARDIVKKVARSLATELKTVTKLVKDTAALKPA